MVPYGYFQIRDVDDELAEESYDEVIELAYDDSCIEEVHEVTLVGGSMQPLIMDGDKLTLLVGYYDCNPLERGQIVSYEYADRDAPIAKMLSVLGGDSLRFDENHLFVNDELLSNSNGEAYIFSENSQKLISLYVKDGILIEEGQLIFGQGVLTGLDSRRFGAVSADDFLGRYLLIEE